MKTDKVDHILTQWQLERPDIDASPMAILGRIGRLQGHISPALQKIFAELDLNPGEFDVIATLLRSGKPYTLTPNQLLQSMMLTSGAMTNRIDRLEKKGLVKRSADPNDRRGVYVSLTPKGAELANRAVEAHVINGAKILDVYTEAERKTLAVLLRKLLRSFEEGE
ncbi:MAG: MarR family transcriptional regulator [Pseudomonadales bacterium]|nr:MarR family transcriptional regulator [Pseudomonadales bacterium]